MLVAIIVIAQYAHDQAVVSAHDQALIAASTRRNVWSLRRTISSNRITFLRLPDNNHSTKKCGRGLYALHACMRRRADMYSITIIFRYKFKIVNNKEKPSTTDKLNQWWKQRRLSTCMILNCTSLKKKKGHKQEN